MVLPTRPRAILVILSIVTLAACGGSRSSRDGDPSEPEAGQVLRGQLVLGHEARGFTPCGADVELWAVDATPGGELSTVYDEMTAGEPYRSIFVEVVGVREPAPAEGFGAEYDAQVTVRELTRVESEGRGCADEFSTFAFRAMGNEPSWNVRIAESGVELALMGGPSGLEFPYVLPATEDDVMTYRSRFEMPASEIEVRLENRECSDSMSGARSDYAAIVRFEDAVLEGCAYRGRIAEEEALAHDVRIVERTLGGCGADGSEACTWFRFAWPQIRSGVAKAAKDRIQSEIDDWIRRPMEEGQEPAAPKVLIPRWEQAYREFKSEFPDSSGGRMVLRTVSVLDSSSSWLSLERSEASYTGGAHPNRSVDFASFRTDTGARLDLSDVVNPGGLSALKVQVEGRFRRAREIPDGTTFSDAGFRFPRDRFELPDGFALTDRSLVFFYNAYEVAPYAMGPTEIRIPTAEIRDLLNPAYQTGS